MRPQAVNAVAHTAALGANPSSVHSLGQRARLHLEAAKDTMLEFLGAKGNAIVVTSGGTEADNLAMSGLALKRRKKDGASVLLLSDLEHPAVKDASERLEAVGFRPRRVRVDSSGRVDMDVFPDAGELANTALIAVMLANNETGVIQPVKEVCAVGAAAGVLVHVDAVQAAGKIPINFNDLKPTTMAVSAHKFGGPRGVGALVFPPEVTFEALWSGGKQQGGLRAGTEPHALAAGMAAAARAAMADLPNHRLTAMRDRLETALEARLAPCWVVGKDAPRLPNTLAIGFAGVSAQPLVRELNNKSLFIGSGAACHGDRVRVSPALAAMGIPAERALEVVRISLGWNSQEEEIDRAISLVSTAVEELRQ